MPPPSPAQRQAGLQTLGGISQAIWGAMPILTPMPLGQQSQLRGADAHHQECE